MPAIRHVTTPPSTGTTPLLLPIETFGRLYLQADNWHTDAKGYELIARAVADAISVPR